MAGDSIFQSRTPTVAVGYGASFGGDFADNRKLIFANDRTKISYAGRVTIEGRPALRYEYDNAGGALGVTHGNQSGFTAARGAFWSTRKRWTWLRVDIESYDVPPGLALQSISTAHRTGASRSASAPCSWHAILNFG